MTALSLIIAAAGGMLPRCLDAFLATALILQMVRFGKAQHKLDTSRCPGQSCGLSVVGRSLQTGPYRSLSIKFPGSVPSACSADFP